MIPLIPISSCNQEQQMKKKPTESLVYIFLALAIGLISSCSQFTSSARNISSLASANSCQQLIQHFFHKKSYFAFVIKNLNDSSLKSTEKDLQSILFRNLNDKEKIAPSTFNAIAEELTYYANKYGIQITNIKNTIGVFPDGIGKIGVSGFKLKNDSNISFATLHELGHLFHTIQLRVSILRSLSTNVDQLDNETLKAINSYIKRMETRGNYLEFEKAVTGLSSVAHLISKRGLDEKSYQEKLIVILKYTKESMEKMKVKFPNGKSFEDIYALFLSKAPLLVGTSIGSLSSRMSIAVFALYYWQDHPVPFDKKKRTTRDFVGQILSGIGE